MVEVGLKLEILYVNLIIRLDLVSQWKSAECYDLCRYFATPYTLPKLDMIAIPDFAAGAMENYGLVTYRETALLYDEKHSAAANKQRVIP